MNAYTPARVWPGSRPRPQWSRPIRSRSVLVHRQCGGALCTFVIAEIHQPRAGGGPLTAWPHANFVRRGVFRACVSLTTSRQTLPLKED